MIRKLALSSAFALLLAGTAQAADLTSGMTLGVETAEIAAALAAQGYELVKVEREHGRIEVKATKDGRRWEVKIDPKTGQIIRVKIDD